jgi:hypothetical protein
VVFRRIGIAVVLALAALGLWRLVQGTDFAALVTGKPSAPVTGGLPLVMTTDGGRLEVSTVTVYERFKRADAVRLFGLDIPGTTSDTHLQVRVVYRYYIEMEKAWPLTPLPGGRWLVRAGAVRPSLPVAFDTRDLEVYTAKGWLRLDAQRNLTELLRTLSPELEARAKSPAYQQLATDAGRKAVADFVRTWLLQTRRVPGAADAGVVVLFPGEVPRLD